MRKSTRYFDIPRMKTQLGAKIVSRVLDMIQILEAVKGDIHYCLGGLVEALVRRRHYAFVQKQCNLMPMLAALITSGSFLNAAGAKSRAAALLRTATSTSSLSC
mmetsp:Transcript_142640/g.455268  ORF Transcript_142640/g.455268 Transcript_142640/m.455268 type:complete len:104 (+) Transcript_142640:193-504(+)